MIEFPTIGFIGLRFTLAAILFLPFATSQLKQLSQKQFLSSSLVGLSYTTYIILWILGLIHSTHFGEGAFLVSLSMLIAPFLSYLLFKHKPNKLFWLSLPIAILGLYLLAANKSSISLSLGSLIFLLSSFLAALYFVLNNQFSRNIPVLSLTTIQIGTVGVCCGLYSLFFEDWPDEISLVSWGWFMASVLITTNTRVLLQTLGQKYCNVTNAAFIMILEPVWTLILSILILGEHLTLNKFFGCLLILAALIIYRLPFVLKK